MVDYHRIGNTDLHLRNATSTTFLHQLRDLWRSPRGTVLRIEALALVAIVLSFLVAAFGSCCRWSNRWIVQKGFLAANVLSLSLGTYSIGIMQSSSVKSQIFPIWAVSLFTLFGCVDSVSDFNGPDYKSPLLKVIFQLFLYCGYVLLMSISTISSDVGNIAIGLLSIITFVKSFHRSLALVLPSRMRNTVRGLTDGVERAALLDQRGCSDLEQLIVDFPLDMDVSSLRSLAKHGINMYHIHSSCKDKRELQSEVGACHDVCFAFSLSHLLQRRFLGLNDVKRIERSFWWNKDGFIDYKWALNVIEVELAFLYDIFFTGSAFLHYYQAKTASFWAFTSFIGICFVGVSVAIPGTMTSRHTTSPGRGTIVVGTTTIDLVITLVILVSLALLQLVQLTRCWTSNWARVAFACEYAMNQKNGISQPRSWWWWMKLKALVVTGINWFDNYLWQNKLGQYSIVERSGRRNCKLFSSSITSRGGRPEGKCAQLVQMLGLQYIGQVLRELLGRDTKTGAAAKLDNDVKASITDFLSQIKSTRTGNNWSSLLVANGIFINELPYTPVFDDFMSAAHSYTSRVMEWHIATCYCELAEKEQTKQGACKETAAAAEREGETEKNRRVATTLSKYCAYLVVSAPELLPGPSAHTKTTFDEFVSGARATLHGAKDKLKAMQREEEDYDDDDDTIGQFRVAVTIGKRLHSMPYTDRWKVLAHLWVQMLVYAVPYGTVEAHMRHLSQGGELITHLWALLYHTGIIEWQPTGNEEEDSEDGG
ncbi:hypothetical protein ACP70R_015110 [Stipagrostis hirtigluma subsp. patula]